MTLVGTYQFEVNALYVIQTLEKLGITATINEKTIEGVTTYEVGVNSDDTERAVEEIKKMNIDDSPVDETSEDYLKGYMEWSDRMYDPGHYTGGKVPHYLTNKTNWKYLAPYFLIGGLFFGYLILKSDSIGLETLTWTGLYIAAGISMIWQLRKKNKKTLSNNDSKKSG